MKKIRICTLFCCLAIILPAGCYGIPIEHNYIGMTKAEAAAHLEKYATRSRWSKNRFAIEISEKGVAAPYWFIPTSPNCSAKLIGRKSKPRSICRNTSVLVKR